MIALHPLEKVLGNTSVFLEKVFSALAADGINVSNYELDHICYRVETKARYEELKTILGDYGELLTEAIIAGRPISTYKLNEPLVYKNIKISCIELPSPKQGSFFPEGFEHVEFVIDLSFQEFIKKYPRIKFDTSSSSKEINPDIIRKYGDFSVKFHHNTLEYIIEYLQ